MDTGLPILFRKGTYKPYFCNTNSASQSHGLSQICQFLLYICYSTPQPRHLHVLEHLWGHMVTWFDTARTICLPVPHIMDIAVYCSVHMPLAAGWHVHSGDQRPWASFCMVFFSQQKSLFSVLSYCNSDLNCLPPVNFFLSRGVISVLDSRWHQCTFSKVSTQMAISA